jgi:hypothetical protein
VQYDPHDSKLLKWLTSFDDEEQYIVRCALLRLFKNFLADGPFKRDTEALRLKLKPDVYKLAQLWRASDERAEEIKRDPKAAKSLTAPKT